MSCGFNRCQSCLPLQITTGYGVLEGWQFPGSDGVPPSMGWAALHFSVLSHKELMSLRQPSDLDPGMRRTQTGISLEEEA